ncbi:hypothetical protein PYCC9005_005887 [Savitreella phatthalungensis]
MSRALRRAKKQQLEDQLAQAAREAEAEDSGDENDGEDEGTAPVRNPFDLLNESEVENDTNENNNDVSSEEEQLKAEEVGSTPTKARQKKKKKKAKQQKQKQATESEAHDDPLDSILAEHQAQLSLQEKETPARRPGDLIKCLQVDIKGLDPNVEMRKLFGSKVIDGERTKRNTPSRNARKSILVPIEDNWPSDIRGNLSMDLLQKYDDGCRDFAFTHGARYRQFQLAFLSTTQAGDPQLLMNLLSRAPFHIDTLLQCSEILRHQGDGEGSLDLLTRALYAFDRAMHPLFNLGLGLARLPFEIQENRPFYLAAYRYIQTLGRRACWTTAFEFNRLIYALDPEFDPYATLLSLDYYAFKARKWDYLANSLPVILEHSDDEPRDRLKHWAYTKALASSVTKDAGFAHTALVSAIESWPMIARDLLKALERPVPETLQACEPAGPRTQLLTDLYVLRCRDIWATPEATALLMKAAQAAKCDSELTKSLEKAYSSQLPYAVYRHVLLLDERTLLHHLPKHITNNPHMMLAWDPIPPENSQPSYLDEYMPSRSSDGASGGLESVPRLLQELLQQAIGAGRPNGNGVHEAADEIAMQQQIQEMLEDVRVEDAGADTTEQADAAPAHGTLARYMERLFGLLGGPMEVSRTEADETDESDNDSRVQEDREDQRMPGAF